MSTAVYFIRSYNRYGCGNQDGGSERTENDLHGLKVVILTWQTENVLASQTSLKIKNWKHYSMKIVFKHKKSPQDF